MVDNTQKQTIAFEDISNIAFDTVSVLEELLKAAGHLETPEKSFCFTQAIHDELTEYMLNVVSEFYV